MLTKKTENVRRDEGEVSPLAGHCNVCGVSPVCHHRRVAMSITIVNVVRTTQVSVPLCKRCFEVANKADFMGWILVVLSTILVPIVLALANDEFRQMHIGLLVALGFIVGLLAKFAIGWCLRGGTDGNMYCRRGSFVRLMEGKGWRVCFFFKR